MIYRHSDEQIQDYFDRDAVNQSTIKVILFGSIQAYLAQKEEILHSDELYYEEKEHFVLGKAIDCLITEGEDTFKRKYHYSNLPKKPADKPMAIVKMVYEKAILREAEDMEELGEGGVISNNIKDYGLEIYNAMNEVMLSTDKTPGYYMNRAKAFVEDTRAETLLKDGLCQAYWEDLIEARGKQVLSEEEYRIINDVVISLTTHKHTKDLLKDGENVDLIFQMPLYPIINEVDCKILPDIIRVNHSTKSIYVIDLKSFGDYIESFPWGIKRRRYDIQGAFYLEGIRQSLQQITQLIGKDITGYEIKEFAFIVESTIKQGCPLVFIMTNELESVGKYGNPADETKGFHQGLQTYKKWTSIDFSMDALYKDTNGVVWVNQLYKFV